MLGKTTTRGKIFYSLTLQTRQLDCLNEIFNLFYILKKRELTKTVKPEVYFYINYIVLAH